MDEKLLLNRLRELLLAEDRKELLRLKKSLEDPLIFSEKVTPLIREQLEFFKKNFPGEFRIAVEEIVGRKIESSKEELLEAIYPSLGLMVRKYVQYQFQQLRESIEQQIANIFQRGIIGRLRYALFGIKPQALTETIMSRLEGPVIEELFVIEHYSGVLLGSASRNNTIDLDMIAGMLTAIKSFVEDAFRQKNEQLESIQYGNFSMVIENFYSYYIVAVIVGTITTQERRNISEELSRFAAKELFFNLKKKDGSSHLEIKQRLESNFFRNSLPAQS